jgi:energy-coupling factor transporter ATP-binding protein EcfA2
MLKTMSVNNYRGFESFTLGGLNRVNLLVGKNNSGKSSLLESLTFLISGGDPTALQNTVLRRAELVKRQEYGPGSFDFSQLFHGRRIKVGSSVDFVGDNGFPPVRFTVVPLAEEDQYPGMLDDFEAVPSLRIRINRGDQEIRVMQPIMLSDEGVMMKDIRHTFRRVGEPAETPPFVFVPPEGLAISALGRMWDSITNEKKEDQVEKSLTILQSDLVDIRFTSAGIGILIGLKNESKRIPIGSMGDGIRRLLALSIALLQARDGYLFIDEIDTGLHYSVMENMWKLVTETAKRLNVQVFATTHSWDCLEGLGELCRSSQALAPEIVVHKIERSLKESVTFAGDQLPLVVSNRTEIR